MSVCLTTFRVCAARNVVRPPAAAIVEESLSHATAWLPLRGPDSGSWRYLLHLL